MYVHAYHHIRTKSLVYIHTRTRTRTHNQILCATERRVRRGLRSSAAFSPLLNATSTSALLPAFFSVTFTLVAALRTTEELQSTPHISNICSTTYVKKKPATFLGICLSFYIMHGDARQHTATYWQSENEQLHRTATHCNTWNALQHIGWRSGILAPAARGLGGGGSSTHTHTHTHTGEGATSAGSHHEYCNTLQQLQHTATHCSTLQHTDFQEYLRLLRLVLVEGAAGAGLTGALFSLSSTTTLIFVPVALLARRATT